ncbi:MAG TPA: tetratricopeptide repeat protein [Actinoplanes sp.]|nr:tetratricopeptide repeat protein [Actinoplanes sp.]
MSTSPSESETTPEEYRQRALLFADLGRYDDAADEIAAGLAAAPADAGLLTTLARVHLAADQPLEALVAAERAVAAAPEELTALVVRAMALTDNQRYGDAAGVATEILRRWPQQPFAQRTGAALLSESRNGQEALNAAWHGVKLAETEPEAHLVLAMVAARLRLFDLAQHAYGRALDLDEAVGDAQRDVGIVRLERRRWARALEALADEAALGTAQPAADPSLPRAYPAPDRPDPAPDADDPAVAARSDVWSGPLPVSRPAGPVLDPSGDSADAVRRAVLYGANGVLVAALLTALMSNASAGASRVWAGLIGVIVFGAVLGWLSRRLTEPMGAAFARLRAGDRRLAVAAYLAFAAPLLVLVYALVGGLIPLIAAMVVAAAAELMVIARR